MSANDDSQKPPSLRIRELTITNFRTFVEPTTISFCDGEGKADAIAVFHGDNGSGKSNALAALDLFFQMALLAVQQKSADDDVLIPWEQPHYVNGPGTAFYLVLSYRDRPQQRSGPMEIDVLFADSRLDRLRAVATPSGNQVRVQLLQVQERTESGQSNEGTAIPQEMRDKFVTWLQTPRGPFTYALTIVDARRRQRRFMNERGHSLMPSSLAYYLHALSTSRSPKDRNTWREFKSIVARFVAFKGKEFSIEPAAPKVPPINEFLAEEPTSPPPELIVEDREKTVLALDELSSGEQHVIVLCAASLLARSAILAIEEPEISLDAKNQRLLHDILQELSDKGIIDQIILESHVALFDGPNVIRFARNDDGSTSVKRGPSLDEAKLEIERQAKEKGAKQRWVTQDGYTRLPDRMVNDLGVQDGGHVWFLKGPNHWEAWREAEVDDFFTSDDGHDD